MMSAFEAAWLTNQAPQTLYMSIRRGVLTPDILEATWDVDWGNASGFKQGHSIGVQMVMGNLI